MIDQKIITHLSKDAKLKKVIAQVPVLGISTSTGDIYYDLIRTITFQQLSGKAATTIFNRFLDLFEAAYPHAIDVVAFEIEDLRAVGLSKQKANYIQNIANYYISENWDKKDWGQYQNEELITYLTQIKGVGKWTVQMILMFSLERTDVLPLDDLVVRNMMIELYQPRGKTKREITVELTAIAEKWRPYRSFASRYLWAWKDTVL